MKIIMLILISVLFIGCSSDPALTTNVPIQEIIIASQKCNNNDGVRYVGVNNTVVKPTVRSVLCNNGAIFEFIALDKQLKKDDSLNKTINDIYTGPKQ